MPSRTPSHPPSPHGGRHELGQNFLIDPRVIARLVRLVAPTRGPILELGPGDGALTVPLSRLGRPITAVELDSRRARQLGERRLRRVQVVHGDVLRHRFPTHPHVVVGNVPFHLTTAILRRVLAEPHWTEAVLLTQWEAARRRAGVGGASLLTVEWMPWVEFELDQRVPARAFRPMPAVDGGLLVMRQRPEPLVPTRDRAGFQRMAQRVFQTPGRRLDRRVASALGLPPARAARWMQEQGIAAGAAPSQLEPRHWASLWREVRPTR